MFPTQDSLYHLFSSQEACQQFLIDEKVFYNYRPEWLKNPLTGYNLELDIYYPNLKLAIEINGLHHKLDYQKYKDNAHEKLLGSKNLLLSDYGKKIALSLSLSIKRIVECILSRWFKVGLSQPSQNSKN